MRAQPAKRSAWVWGIAALIAAWGGWFAPVMGEPHSPALEALCAPDPKEERVEVIVSLPEPKYNHSLTLDQVKRMSPMAESRNTLVFGETRRKIYFQTMLLVANNVFADNRQCYFLQKVEIKLGSLQPEVFIASDYPKGGCEYQSILDHEQRHLRVFDDAVRKYKPIFRDAVSKEIQRIGVVWNMGAAAKDYFNKRIEKVVREKYEALQNEMTRGDQQVDAEESKRDDFDRCRNWGVTLNGR